YDFRGQRVIKRGGGGAESLYPDPAIELHDGAASLWVSFAGRRVLALFDGGELFLHTDHLGTATLYTDLSVAERLPEGLYNISEPYRIGTMLSYALKEVASWIASSYGLVMVRRCARLSNSARSRTWRRRVKS